MAQSETPSCFGKDWDKRAPECTGGADPNYVHPLNGSHTRDTCNFFQACGARKLASQAVLLPSASLIRPPVITPPPVTAPQTFADSLRQVNATREAALANLRQQQQQPFGPYPVQVTHPAQTYQLSYVSPAFLSVPEERHPGETLFSVLCREIFRSMLKALGHALANFFDTRIWKTPGSPPT